MQLLCHYHWTIQGAASHDGKLYVVGGGYLNRDNIIQTRLFIYDHTSNKWTEGANLPTVPGALTANFINGILYAVGGVDKSETLTSTYVGI